MQVVTYSSFRKNLKSALDQVTEDGELVIINQSENKNVVLHSLIEYNVSINLSKSVSEHHLKGKGNLNR